MVPSRIRTFVSFARLFLAVGSCLLLAGCSDAPSSRLVPISGVVTMDGQPLAGALVEFEPVPGRAGDPSFNPSSAGTTDDEGRFRLDTPFGSGAVPGEHLVKIWETVEVESDEEELHPEKKLELRLLPEFSNQGLPYTVPEEGTREADFVLQSTPATVAQAEVRRSSGDRPKPASMTTRGHPSESESRVSSTSRAFWCTMTIVLWLFALAGCFKWWKNNERRLLEGTF